MSGLAGIFNLDGRPVEPLLLRRMTEAVAHRGPDGLHYWVEGPLGIGHAMLCTTPESLHETQPLTDETGNLCLALDGRVDNREELKAALEAGGLRLRTDTDAELVLRAYEYWGEESPQRILGDFAYVIWDGSKRQLFCVRDPLGIKPLYYYMDGRTFRWGSELHQILEDHTIRRQPNEGMIAEHLANAITNLEETLYQGILRLPPAHLLVIQAGGARKQRYWCVDPSHEIRYRTDQEYSEHFYDIFREAVRCRLRSHKPVGAELSGGLDSSSVVCVAQRLYRDRALPDLGFETFSCVLPDLPWDESPYIQEVVRAWNLRSNALGRRSDGSWYAECARRYLDFPGYPNGHMTDLLTAVARDKGFRVMLTGVGGDNWFTGSPPDGLPDRIHRVLHRLRSQSSLQGVVAESFRIAGRLLGGTPPVRIAPVIPAEFARRTRLSDRLRRDLGGLRFRSPVHRKLWQGLTYGFFLHAREMTDRSAAGFGLEFRHPFCDRRVVEFALAVPDHQHYRDGQTKFLLRRALRGVLPEMIRQRSWKAEASYVAAEALLNQGAGQVFDALEISRLGWIDGEQVRSMFQEVSEAVGRGQKDYLPHIWYLLRAFGIEVWFRSVFAGGGLVARAPARRTPRQVANRLAPRGESENLC